MVELLVVALECVIVPLGSLGATVLVRYPAAWASLVYKVQATSLKSPIVS